MAITDLTGTKWKYIGTPATHIQQGSNMYDLEGVAKCGTYTVNFKKMYFAGDGLDRIIYFYGSKLPYPDNFPKLSCRWSTPPCYYQSYDSSDEITINDFCYIEITGGNDVRNDTLISIFNERFELIPSKPMLKINNKKAIINGKNKGFINGVEWSNE